MSCGVSFYWKNHFFRDLCGIQTLKIIYLSYLGKVYENLVKKNSKFSKIETFPAFPVFVSSCKASSKRRNLQKI